MKFLARLLGRGVVSTPVEPPSEPLTIEAIRNAASDDALLSLLSAELGRVIPDDLENYNELAAHIRRLPEGLRGMAAVHRLDVSLSLDTLKEHFSNFHSLEYAELTHRGLIELELDAFADIFETALTAVKPHWDSYSAASIEPFLAQQLLALTEQMWDLKEQMGLDSLMDTWPAYARRHPDKVVGLG